MRIDEKTYTAMPAEVRALFRKLPNPGSDEVLALFPDAPGQLVPESLDAPSNKSSNVYRPRGRRPSGFGDVGADGGDSIPNGAQYLDTGSAARFFYTAKASKDDRDDGLHRFPERSAGIKNDSGRGFSERDAYAEIKRRNHHPTVKPVDLMRYLCRLITPPGGTILDPFTGSGSTGKAALLEGFNFVGIELDPEYAAIARDRVYAAAPLFAAEVA